jgi:hypothetical protein
MAKRDISYHKQPEPIRPLGKGETVNAGDWLQIGDSFFPLGDDGDPNEDAWVGHVIEHGGTFERVWRPVSA